MGRDVEEGLGAASDGLVVNRQEFIERLQVVFRVWRPEPGGDSGAGVALVWQPNIAVWAAVTGRGDPRFCLGQWHGIPGGIGSDAAFGSYPADGGVGGLENHRLWAMLFEEIADLGYRAAVEPDLGDFAIAGEEFGELCPIDLVVDFLLGGCFADTVDGGVKNRIAGAKIDPELHPALLAGGGKFFDHIALAVAPRGVLDAEGTGIRLPPAEAVFVFGDED